MFWKKNWFKTKRPSPVSVKDTSEVVVSGSHTVDSVHKDVLKRVSFNKISENTVGILDDSEFEHALRLKELGFANTPEVSRLTHHNYLISCRKEYKLLCELGLEKYPYLQNSLLEEILDMFPDYGLFSVSKFTNSISIDHNLSDHVKEIETSLVDYYKQGDYRAIYLPNTQVTKSSASGYLKLIYNGKEIAQAESGTNKFYDSTHFIDPFGDKVRPSYSEGYIYFGEKPGLTILTDKRLCSDKTSGSVGIGYAAYIFQPVRFGHLLVYSWVVNGYQNL